MSRRRSKCSTCQGAQSGANDSGTNRNVVGRLSGGLVPYRLLSGSLAVLIVSLERFISLVRTGHGRKRWGGWTVIGASPTREAKSADQRERFFEHRHPRLYGPKHSYSITQNHG